jgi:hypothetical protein
MIAFIEKILSVGVRLEGASSLKEYPLVVSSANATHRRRYVGARFSVGGEAEENM